MEQARTLLSASIQPVPAVGPSAKQRRLRKHAPSCATKQQSQHTVYSGNPESGGPHADVHQSLQIKYSDSPQAGRAQAACIPRTTVSESYTSAGVAETTNQLPAAQQSMPSAPASNHLLSDPQASTCQEDCATSCTRVTVDQGSTAPPVNTTRCQPQWCLDIQPFAEAPTPVAEQALSAVLQASNLWLLLRCACACLGPHLVCCQWTLFL